MRPTRIAALFALLSVGLSVATNADAALLLGAGGMTVIDTSTGATWLANMDLPASMPLTVPSCTSAIFPNCINANGSMNYQTAQSWISALNADNGVGYLGRNNWQLPTTQYFTEGCMSNGKNGESFGYGCTGSALGSLYKAMGLTAPASVAGAAVGTFKGFANLQPNLYWSNTSSDPVGFFTFSMASGWRGANIGLDVPNRNPAANFFYVLPMLDGNAGIPGTIYDPASNKSWLADGNIAATNRFGLSLCSGLGSATSAPCVNANGSMTHTSAQALIDAMNSAGYLGQTHWRLPPSFEAITCHYAECAADPSKDALASLYYNLLGLNAGESVANYYTSGVGPFWNVQPYLYWSCQAQNAQGSALNSVCSPVPQCTSASQPHPCAADMEWSFNFGDGLQGTDEEINSLFVTAFSPPPSPIPEPPGWALLMSGLGIFWVMRRPRPKRKTDDDIGA